MNTTKCEYHQQRDHVVVVDYGSWVGISDEEAEHKYQDGLGGQEQDTEDAVVSYLCLCHMYAMLLFFLFDDFAGM